MNNIPQIIYAIKMPYISNGLKRTYNKQLKVYKLELDGDDYYKQASTITFKSINNYKESTSCRANLRASKSVQLRITTEVNNIYHNSIAYFADMKTAYIAKLLLVRGMRLQYEAELDNLRDLMNRNIPKLNEHIEEASEEYPELFV